MEEHRLTADELSPRAQLNEMWQEACDRGRSCSFRVVSGSMRPLIEIGDVVKVTRAEPSRIRIGDVVVFREGQVMVVHRIIRKSWSNQQLEFRHSGDAGVFSGTIAAQNLIGKVSVIEKDGRRIFLDTPWRVMSNRILGWRLRLVHTLGQAKYKHTSRGLRLALRPMWRLCRSLLLWRF